MKKVLSIMLSVIFVLTMLVPAFSTFAIDEDSVHIEAESINSMTIQESDSLPEDGDYDGVLMLEGGSFDIERDYSQSATIMVTNTSDLSVEYYLTVLNIYDDIYLNFVRSGSPEIPLVIAAGETQEIQLDIFAQNAKHRSFEFPIYAHTVMDDSETIDAKTTAYVNCPLVELDVTLTKINEDASTLAQMYSLRNNGRAVSDLEVSLTGDLYDYVMLTPINEYVYMNSRDVIEFTAMPDLTKMKMNNVDCIEGQIVVSAGGDSVSYDTKFDTQGQEITTITVGELVALQMNGFSTESLQTKAQGMGTIKIPSNNTQCTNAGKVTSKAWIPSTGKGSISTKSTDDSDVRIFLTSRMYGGSYVNKTETNYDYYVNGVKVATSHNSGLTEVSIVELPTDNIKFGATNVIVRDYDTNPGSHSVVANTEISILYPADTPISYIGSPETLPDYRSLPDFAVYTENIFNSTNNIVIGNESELNINVYNRGSVEGTFNISVSDGENVIYSEENHYLDAFSGDKISFKWTPDSFTENITITLENTTEGLVEDELSNNTASRTFKVRERVKPVIKSITPDYAVEGEAIVYASVSGCDDVVSVKFFVDDQLYTGEVKSSPYGSNVRYWINDSDMAVGTHKIKVVVEYSDTDKTTAIVEKTADFNVFDSGWNYFTFELDEDIEYPIFYIYDSIRDYDKRVYDVTKDGQMYTYFMTKEEYDNKANYDLFVVSEDAVLFAGLDENKSLKLADCNTLTFVGDNTFIDYIYVSGVNDADIYEWLSPDGKLTLMPATYTFEIGVSCMGYYKEIELEVDMTAGDITIDLSKYFDILSFEINDEINGIPNTTIYYMPQNSETWNTVALNTELVDNKYICTLDFDSTDLRNSSKAFVVFTTNDILFVDDLNLSNGCIQEKYIIEKSKLQHYSLSAGGSITEFDITGVEIVSDDFTAWLFSSDIYVTPREYKITVYCRDISDLEILSSKSDSIAYAESEEVEQVGISFDIGSAFNKHASIVGAGENNSNINIENYLSGSEIKVNKDNYNINVNLFRNKAVYNVLAKVDATRDSVVTPIGNTFKGDIVNSFDTYKAYSTVRLYIDDLFDDNGNELVAFNSKNDEDRLYGRVIFTNVANTEEYKSVSVELDNISYIDVVLPDLEGTYNVKLVVSSESELKDLSGLYLSAAEVAITCGESYLLEAFSVPEGVDLSNLVWTSSDERIASVDENGLVTANSLKRGTTVITVTTSDGLYSATCDVTVEFTTVQWIVWFITGGFKTIIYLLFRR